jgi:hypothetical protein
MHCFLISSLAILDIHHEAFLVVPALAPVGNVAPLLVDRPGLLYRLLVCYYVDSALLALPLWL